jgi:hydrogenase maturation protein HypF
MDPDRLILVTGTVQGVGFRPFVARLAARLGVRGWVRNDGHGVAIRAAAPPAILADFETKLRTEAPPAARLETLTSRATNDDDPLANETGFAIVDSEAPAAAPTAAITPDLALCDDCRRELAAPRDRRRAYPFINCTNCGPRYSILRELPYDRPNTTMAEFTMCPACQREYDDPANRRYHAQPNACPVCGPHVELHDSLGRMLADHAAAIARAAAALHAGRIVAVKGIGGFHLLVDATNDDAVRELRRRKHREEKPLAVMFPSLEALAAVADTTYEQRRLLASPAAPIVLVRRRPDASLAASESFVLEQSSSDMGGTPMPRLPAGAGGTGVPLVGLGGTGVPPVSLGGTGVPPVSSPDGGSNQKTVLAASVAPGNPWIGAMLPYAPLHVLLLAEVNRPVVATSGNLSEEPLCIDDREAAQRLGSIADLFLGHNRGIARPVDDSVVRSCATGPLVLRRARGYAPTPFRLPPDARPAEPLLCVGAHMKNTVAVTAGDRLVLSPHIGDLGNAVSTATFERTVDLLGRLYGGRFARVACDAHPDYASTRFAEKLGVPVVRVQHHLAHILACLLDNEGHPDRVLGVAWDGTGYGSDGTIWGGEFILVDRKARTARRVAHLRPFQLPGGETAVREPRRVAFSLLHTAFGPRDPRTLQAASALGLGHEMQSLLHEIVTRGLNSPVTTSVGRLFDGVAALLGLRTHTHFEGQAAMDVEFCADAADGEGAPLKLDVRPEAGSGKQHMAGSAAAVAEPLPAPCGTEAVPLRMPASERQAGGKLILDWAPLLADLLTAAPHIPAPALAAGFHRALAEAIGEVAARCGVETVALTGGCFQNARLLELSVRHLRDRGHTVLIHRALPPNDGSIAAGQALAAGWGLTNVEP